ncbi:hypothetical protein BTVI_48805 [Pitangus sulphuratus]|nr:hypothetical protein BTVI_48805 [Pitangus sulphuratus]
MSETSSQPDLLIVDAALQVTGCQECLMPLCKAGADKQLFCRRYAAVEELCCQVKELQEEVNKLHSIQANGQKRDQLFSETLQSQDSRESQPSTAVEKQVNSELYKIITQRSVAQGSVKDEGWKVVTACTRRKVPPPSQNLTGIGYNVPHLKCFYTNAHSIRNKQEELKALAQSQRFEITGISETWWDETCDWSALLDGYRLFRRPPIQDDDTDELFFGDLMDTSKTTAIVLMGDFNLPEINWEHHTAGTTRARRFLKNLDDSFMEQVLRKPTWKDSLLDLLDVNRVDLVSEVVIGGCLRHSDHEATEFKISVNRSKSASKTSALDMRRADFRLLGELDENGNLSNRDRDKAEMFYAFFASVFNTDDGPRGSQCPELEDHDCENQLPVDPELLLKLDPYKSMRLDGIHPRILKELADVIAECLLMIFEQSWEYGEVPDDWKLANIVPIFKKGKKDDPGNYRPVSLTSVPGKVMEKIILGRTEIL